MRTGELSCPLATLRLVELVSIPPDRLPTCRPQESGGEGTICCQALQSSHPFEEHPMQGIYRRRIGRRLAGISVLAFLVFMIAPSLARPQTQAQADGDKPKEDTSKENTPSSYDQIAAALLG